MPFRAVALATALAFPPAEAFAEWALDRSHTHIGFTVDHLGFSDVTGMFRAFEAEVDFDLDDLAATRVTMTIDAASVDTFWEIRDEAIRSKDFLDVANHPEIRFVTTAVTPTGDDAATVTGDLTLRGETNEVRFDATLNRIGRHPFMPELEIAGFTLTGEIDRTAFGMDFAAPMIGAVIPVTINVELTRGG